MTASLTTTKDRRSINDQYKIRDRIRIDEQATMADVYEWLGGVDQSMDEIFADDPTDQIMALDIDEDDNMYFDVSHTSNAPFE